MESKRQLQVAALIKRNFSAVLQQEGNYIYQDALVTVTNVKVTPDLSLAKIYLSIYNTDNKQAVLLKLEDQHHRLKQIFAQRIRKHIRRIPDFSMYIDETLDEMYRVDALFERLGQQASASTQEEE
jgi:ribosome-binding factor A